MKDPLTELKQWALDEHEQWLQALRAAGYPARREAERRVIEAARFEAREHLESLRACGRYNEPCYCDLCFGLRALDAATPKGATDAE